MKSRCSVCHLPYSECRYPISHHLPTVNTIKLPNTVFAAARKYQTPTYAEALTAADRQTLNRVNLFQC